jgi:hypothetical protein
MRGAWRAILAAGLLVGAGCANLCPCCDWCNRDERRPIGEGPPPAQGRLPPGVVPTVGPPPGSGAYGGTGP